MLSKVVECRCSHTRWGCPQGTARIQVAIANTARCPGKKFVRGGTAGGVLASGSSKFPAKGFCPKRAPPFPRSHPQRHPKTLRMTPPNDRKASKMRCWGASWATLGAFG